MAVLRARFRGGAAGGGGGVALALAPVAGAALAVETSAKNGDDGKDVLRELELGGGGSGGGVAVVCVHDDLRTVPVENVLEQIECEPTEPVFVGNVHRS